MEIRWTVYVQREGSGERVPLVRLRRPVDTATVSDFGLSIAEGRLILRALQTTVAQDHVVEYDLQRRHCRHCGAYRRIKDWRPLVFATGLGEIHLRVPRVVSCLCTPEPLDDQDEPRSLRYSECPIETLLPSRRTPEVSYLCAKHGASSSYRSAAQHVVAIAGLRGLSHASVRKETVRSGELIEDAQFYVGWFAGGRKQTGAEHLRVAIDGTVLTETPSQEVSKFEVSAGWVERDGYMGRRFVCAEPRRTLTRVLVAAALEQSGWTPATLVDVVIDGARGMRSLVAGVAPRIAPKILDWFHLAMKVHAVKSPIFARTYYRIDRPEFMNRCERLWKRIRNALWRGRGEAAIEITRSLVASLRGEIEVMPPFYRECAVTAHGAASALLTFLVSNRKDLVDYQRARMSADASPRHRRSRS